MDGFSGGVALTVIFSNETAVAFSLSFVCKSVCVDTSPVIDPHEGLDTFG